MARKPMPTYESIEEVVQSPEYLINVATVANILYINAQTLRNRMEAKPECIPFSFFAVSQSSFRIPRIPFLMWLLGPDWEGRA